MLKTGAQLHEHPPHPTSVLGKAKNFVIHLCINDRRSRDKAVHNLALHFNAERNKPDELLACLRQQEITKENGTAINFEIANALD